MPRGIYIPANPAKPLEEHDYKDHDDLMHTLAGFINAVDLPNAGVTLYVHDNGFAMGMPFNSRATWFYWLHNKKVRQQINLVGDAILVGFPDEEGNPTDLPEETMDLLLHTRRYAVEVQAIGDPKWTRDHVSFHDYGSAAAWALLMLQAWIMASDVRIVSANATYKDGSIRFEE